MFIKMMIPVEYIDVSGFLIITIKKDLIDKIKKVSSFIEENDLYSAQQSIPSPDYYTGDLEDEDEEREPLKNSVHDNSLIIKSTECFIKGFIGNSYVESEYFDVGYLEKLFHIKELPIEHMGIYLNDEDENIRNIARERLERKE